MKPDLGREPGRFGPGEHTEAAGVPGRRAHGSLQAGDGLDVVVAHVGAGGEQQSSARRSPLAVADERLDVVPGRARADGGDARGHVGHAAVGEVVAGHHREHGVVEAHPGDRRGDPRRLVGRRRRRLAGCRPGRSRTPGCSARRAP